MVNGLAEYTALRRITETVGVSSSFVFSPMSKRVLFDAGLGAAMVAHRFMPMFHPGQLEDRLEDVFDQRPGWW